MVRQKLALRKSGIAVCVMAAPACGRSKSCLGCPCRGWCEQSFAFSHNIVLCVPHTESLMVSENGALLPWRYLQQVSPLATTHIVLIFMAPVGVLTFLKDCSFVFPTRRLNWLD